jgi:fimbrial chaperone protein
MTGDTGEWRRGWLGPPPVRIKRAGREHHNDNTQDSGRSRSRSDGGRFGTGAGWCSVGRNTGDLSGRPEAGFSGVNNSDDRNTFLIQSWVENSDGKKDGRFVITPPLFVMQGKKENTLRIIDATNHSLPADRESLFWVNVKAIPSVDKSQMKANTLQLAITSRIKLFYRPLGLNPAPDKAWEQLRFRRSAGVLTVINPTPYFLTVVQLNAGTRILGNTMVAPKGEYGEAVSGCRAGHHIPDH